MIPPGLAFLTLSDRAWKAYETSKMPKFYFDVGKYNELADSGQPPFTPAVSLYYGLDVALEMMDDEGIEQSTPATTTSPSTPAARSWTRTEMLAEGPAGVRHRDRVRVPEASTRPSCWRSSTASTTPSSPPDRASSRARSSASATWASWRSRHRRRDRRARAAPWTASATRSRRR